MMALVEEGRVCMKKFGRDAGDKAVITKVIDASFVEVMTHSRPKARRCNIKHLEFLGEKIDAKNREQVNATLEIEAKKQPERPSQKK
jgi:ribosomal protein L14E/L6E/L27E